MFVCAVWGKLQFTQEKKWREEFLSERQNAQTMKGTVLHKLLQQEGHALMRNLGRGDQGKQIREPLQVLWKSQTERWRWVLCEGMREQGGHLWLAHAGTPKGGGIS